MCNSSELFPERNVLSSLRDNLTVEYKGLTLSVVFSCIVSQIYINKTSEFQVDKNASSVDIAAKSYKFKNARRPIQSAVLRWAVKISGINLASGQM